ncbi:phospholipase D family protein [Acinetobacter sp. ANC 4636]
MQLCNGGKSLDKKISALVRKHKNIAFAVAWASPDTIAFNTIYEDRDKITKAVIGTHFYQTHPDVLDKFTNSEKCHFVLQPDGVFHPKVFLFWSPNSWDLLIGSANLTKGALTTNTELLVHITSSDSTEEFRDEVEQTITSFWEQGSVVTRQEAQNYRNLWNTQKNYLVRVSGNYNNELDANKVKSPLLSNIMTMSWSNLFTAIKNDPYPNGFQNRCGLLKLAKATFESKKIFSHMSKDERLIISGLPNQLYPEAGWFGSMKGSGSFFQAINQNNQQISDALDEIPLEGAVTIDHYNAYIQKFEIAYERTGIATATRLLALKRPDIFICVDGKNKKNLCKDFGISQSKINYDTYWKEIICRIMDSVWWNSTKPTNEIEQQAWNGRVAMLDVLFYD